MRTETKSTQTCLDQHWEAVLALKNTLRNVSRLPTCLGVALGPEPRIALHPNHEEEWDLWIVWGSPVDLPSPQTAMLVMEDELQTRIHFAGGLKTGELAFWQRYLPYCFLSYQAQQLGRAISVSHFAQTLDGKIATLGGDSKWIGNQENLKHAHRMRALCEGILIGGQTLVVDQPKLTVRHVSGPNPRRVVLASKLPDLSPLLACLDDPVWVIGLAESELAGYPHGYWLPRQHHGRIDGNDVLRCLFEQGIHSVYVEGGSQTTSNFLADGAIDILQLHLAPLIFGSGLDALQLPTIQWVSESIKFETSTFLRVGDGMMFVGKPA
ncbi:MAG: dihydrofolate reductase family protein [Bacteroidota bacterium]